jgi:hypothetical protein
MGWSSLAADVSGAVKNDDGQYFIEHEGDQWQVVEDKDNARVYYYSATKQKSQWEDPRTPGAYMGTRVCRVPDSKDNATCA